MGDILKFPDRWDKKEVDEEGNFCLRGIPGEYLMEKVFETNFTFLNLADDFEIADFIEFFVDRRYPGKILVDVGTGEIRGLYEVDQQSFELVKLSINH